MAEKRNDERPAPEDLGESQTQAAANTSAPAGPGDLARGNMPGEIGPEETATQGGPEWPYMREEGNPEVPDSTAHLVNVAGGAEPIDPQIEQEFHEAIQGIEEERKRQREQRRKSA